MGPWLEENREAGLVIGPAFFVNGWVFADMIFGGGMKKSLIARPEVIG